MSRLVSTMKRHMGLIRYTALNYVDKGLSFAIPLIVLWMFEDKKLYNEIEYIYSIAAVLSVLIEVGVRNYSLYAYKIATDREQLTRDVKGIFLFQFAVYVGIGIVSGTALYFATGGIRLIFMFVAVRALFMYFVSFFTIYYRLVDRPSAVFGFSIGANVLTIGVLLWSRQQGHGSMLVYFFVSQFILVLATSAYFLFNRSTVSLDRFFTYIRGALKYSWPIIANVMVFMAINSYGRVYAQNFLSQDAMFHISMVQRLAYVIQLAHVSGIGYLSKRVFIEPDNRIGRGVLITYSTMIAVSILVVVGLILVLPLVRPDMAVGLGLVTVLVIIYTVIWCYISFFELYLNKRNRTRYVLYFSLSGTAVFVGLLTLTGSNGLTAIAVSMVSGMAVNLALNLIYVLRQRRNTIETETAVGEYEYSAV